MTTLSKDEILRLAREAGALLDPLIGTSDMTFSRRGLETFATLCRTDLIEEIRTLKADAENFSPTIGLVDKLQVERDALRQAYGLMHGSSK